VHRVRMPSGPWPGQIRVLCYRSNGKNRCLRSGHAESARARGGHAESARARGGHERPVMDEYCKALDAGFGLWPADS
jgi:hypothetical protein